MKKEINKLIGWGMTSLSFAFLAVVLVVIK